MANNRVQVKRTSTAGRTPNTTGSYATNSQYISAGELALNMADGILYTSNGSAIIEVGANNSNYNTNGNITLATNGKSVKFATKNTSAYAYFSQQTDDNFVFYSTDTAYNPRAIWSVFANSASSNLNISVRTQFNGGLYIPTGASLLDSTGSQGSAGQILASNGAGNVYWVTPGAAAVNTSAQFTWTNTHTFNNPIYANTVNATSYTVGTSTIANATGVYTGVVNGSSITVGTSLIGNSTGVYHTGIINAASHTIGTTFIANTTGTYHTGTVNATTISTGTVNVINASGLTTTANVNIGATGELIVTAGAGIYANGGLGSAGQVLTSNASSVYWSTVSGGTGATLNANNTDTATYYFGMANTSSGSWSNAVVSTTKISFVPNTGALTVNGSISATTKSFLIAHPTKPGMMLRYASLEGPENGVYVRGRIDGTNVIELPDYWEGLVDFDTITVNLTSIGHAQNLYVAAIDGLKIHIDTENHTQPYFYYHVYAERKDVEKLVVEY